MYRKRPPKHANSLAEQIPPSNLCRQCGNPLVQTRVVKRTSLALEVVALLLGFVSMVKGIVLDGRPRKDELRKIGGKKGCRVLFDL
jgi:hypothetical protein